MNIHRFLNVEDLRLLLGIGKNSAYELMHRSDFPSFKIGKRYFIEESALILWSKEKSS